VPTTAADSPSWRTEDPSDRWSGEVAVPRGASQPSLNREPDSVTYGPFVGQTGPE